LENTQEEDEINDLEQQIDELQDELDSIVPDDEPTEEMIERKVERYTRLRDEKDWLEELGRDLKEYVDMRKVAEDIVDHDGIGAMSSYDGKYDEVYITGPDGTRHNFVIVRTN
jgi:predicted nuclease with TOPRIM domain